MNWRHERRELVWFVFIKYILSKYNYLTYVEVPIVNDGLVFQKSFDIRYSMTECSIMNLNEIKVEYLISFSDAIFAFSITFMALSIQLPNFSANIAESGLTRRLSQIPVPSIIHYVISFMVVRSYWISYHRIFQHIRRVDPCET
jgi:hypothetical protein